jgi:membrane protein DedA with SNARE-associated domain
MTHAAQFAVTHGAALLFTWILLQQAGVPIPSVPLLIAAGSLASSRRLGLASSLLAALGACLLADGFWYRVGRRGWHKGARLCRTNSKWKDRALGLIRGHSAVALLLAKFIAGSNWASLLAGQAGISAARFVIYDSIGSLTWSGGYIALGYLLRGHLHWTLAQTLRPLFIARVAVSLARLWRRRSLAHAVLALAIVFFAVRPVIQHNAGQPTPVLHNRLFFLSSSCAYCGYLILGGSANELRDEEERHVIECKATRGLIGVGSNGWRRWL